MSCEAFGTMLLERLRGSLPGADERRLREHLEGCEGCRREADELEETWSLLEGLGEEPSSEGMRIRFYEMLTDVQEEERRAALETRGPLAWIRSLWPAQPVWQVAIAAATFVVGLWIGPRLGGGEIEELRSEMRSMTRAVTLSLLDHPSVTERLRAVSLTETVPDDDKVTRALLTAIAEDDSVNVRLAALGVLSGMLDQPRVRTGILEALERQTAPMMQAAMADVLLAADEPRSKSAVRGLLEKETVNPDVKNYIRKALEPGDNRI